MRSPLTIGALVPSSKALANCMAAQINDTHEGMILDLGAGTGVMTAALLRARIRPERLVVVERDARLHALLKKRYPKLHVLHGDAQTLVALLAEHRIAPVAAVVSSLPLLSMPPKLRRRMVEQMVAVMQPDSLLVQFTYGMHSPIPKKLMGSMQLQGECVRRVWMNLPPARVWVYRKKF